MISVMQRQFLPYALLCRLGGCFFIPSFWKPLENAKVTWRSSYTAYAAFAVASWFSVELAVIVKRCNIRSNLSYHDFPSLLLIILQATVSLKALLNFVTVATGSSGLVKFFKKASVFEKTTGFLPSSRCNRGVWRQRWSFLRRFFVVQGIVSTYVFSTLLSSVSLTAELPDNFGFLGKIGAVLTGMYYLLYDVFPYIVLSSCSSVLVAYLQAQVKIFERCCRFGAVHNEMHLSQQLEVIRHNLGGIRDLKHSLNAIWEAPLVAMSAGVLLDVCIVFYAIFHDGFFRSHVRVAVSYCLYSSFAFMDMACISQALTDEAQKLKDATKAAYTFAATHGYVQQLRYLHETIDPDEMCLSGAGFFRLNKSLLVSMAGTIITYTVILSQTSDGLVNKAMPRNETQLG